MRNMSKLPRSNSRIYKAALQFRRLRDREEHPDGSFDKAGRWYPSDDEELECCHSVRGPSRAYPYPLLQHCRTAVHVAKTWKVEVREVRRVARLLDQRFNQEESA